MDKICDFLIRFRTWILNAAMALMIVAPDLLSSAEVLAVIPADYQRYVIAAGFLLNIWMRPRPAVRASDPEVHVPRGDRQ